MWGIPWYVFVLVAAVLVAAVTILEKKELETEHSLEYVVVLSVFNLLMAMFLWPWVNFDLPAGVLQWIYLASVLGSLSIWFTAKVLRHQDVSVVAPLQGTNVIFAIVFAVLFLGEKVTMQQAAGIIVLVTGALMLSSRTMHSSAFANSALLAHKKLRKGIRTPGFYYGLMVIAMVLLGASAVIDKLILNQIDVITFIFFVHIFLTLNHLVIYGVVHRGYATLPRGLDKAGWAMVGVSVMTLVARLSMSQGLALSEVALVAPLKKVSSLITTIVGGKMFNERGVWARAAIALVMLLGVWLVVGK